MVPTKTIWARATKMATKYKEIMRTLNFDSPKERDEAMEHFFTDAWYSGFKAGVQQEKRRNG